MNQPCLSTLHVFTLNAVKMIDKCWSAFTESDRVELVKEAVSRLSLVQDYEIAAVICGLFVRCGHQSAELPSMAQRDLTELVHFALEHRDSLSERQLTLFEVFMRFTGGDGEESPESRVSQHCPELFAVVFGRGLPEAAPVSVPATTPQRSFTFDRACLAHLGKARPVSDPVLKAQLRSGTCHSDKAALERIC